MIAKLACVAVGFVLGYAYSLYLEYRFWNH